MPFATIVSISVGKDKDMARACDAIGPILPFAAPQYFDRCWGKAEMTVARPERR